LLASIADLGACTLEVMFEDEAPVAWPAMPYRAKVFGSDGSEIGSAESLLGDEEADIFHGIVVKRGHDKKMVEIPATRVKKIFASGVLTDLDSADVATLQPYREEHWYHLGWGGLFRKHPEWSER
jgi:hypothetical protein